MAKLVLLSFCVFAIAGIALSAPANEEDYTKVVDNSSLFFSLNQSLVKWEIFQLTVTRIFQFENHELLLALHKFNREAKGDVVPGLVPDSVIDPPMRCKPCYKPDIRGKCRRIIDCQVWVRTCFYLF